LEQISEWTYIKWSITVLCQTAADWEALDIWEMCAIDHEKLQKRSRICRIMLKTTKPNFFDNKSLNNRTEANRVDVLEPNQTSVVEPN
jgi:hypothetical protein